MKGGDVVYSHTYRLGSLRLRETLEALRAPTLKVRNIMETHIHRTVAEIAEHVSRDGPIELIAMGGDVRFAVRQLQPDWDGHSLARLPLKALEDLTNKILGQSDDKLVRKYRLSFPEAETLGPALLAYVLLAKELQLSSVLVTNVNLRDGLLTEMAGSDAWSQGVQPSRSSARRWIWAASSTSTSRTPSTWPSSCSHAVSATARTSINCRRGYEVILHVAALLHEIGLFVSNRSYHKHSLYLIRNSELFGLGKKDLLLAALVARYHRRASPQPTHEGYATLDRDERVAVAKMAAILRVADRPRRIAQPADSRSHVRPRRGPAGDLDPAGRGPVARTAGPQAERLAVRRNIRHARAAAHGSAARSCATRYAAPRSRLTTAHGRRHD